MKSGANFKDQNNIKRMAKQGRSVSEISQATRIDPKAVESFVNQSKGKKVFGPAKKPAAKPAE